MKNLIIALISLVFFNTAYADGYAKIRMKLSGPVHNNKYFLCVTNAGCMSVYAAMQGKQFSIDEGKINNIFTTDMTNRRMYTQPLPQSCDITVKENQTLVISGKIVAHGTDKVSISHLMCSVS